MRPLIACVGDSTASEFSTLFGRTPDFTPGSDQTAAGLAAEILSHCREPQAVLYVRGSKTSGGLAGGLQQHGWSVSELVVYRNEQPGMQPLEPAGPVLAVFASPSAVERFFAVNPALKTSLECVAIGPVTAHSLNEMEIQRIKTAATPDLRSVAGLVIQQLREQVVNGT
jgi:uroporphyrinogen-III synthase